MFEVGATYRAKKAFQAFRDSFDPAEQLVFYHRAVSIHDDMEGWFFHVVGSPSKVRAWDHGLGEKLENPFEKIAGVDPIVIAASKNDAGTVARLALERSEEDAYLRVALDVAVRGDHADVVRSIARSRKLSRGRLVRALSDAATDKKVESARALLGEGVCSDEAIWSAAWSGSTAIVEALIAHGADPTKMGRPIEEVLAFCERQRHPEIARILERYR